MTKLIGTHDSATGEKGQGFLSWLVTPFAKTQNKTIIEQLNAGCTWFDIRCKYDKHGVLRAAHGLWKSKKTILEILTEIENWAKAHDTDIFVNLTYEGKRKIPNIWKATCEAITDNIEYSHIHLLFVNIKYPTWQTLENYSSNVKKKLGDKWKDIAIGRGENCFKEMNFSSWHTLIPIPWLWKRFYFKEVEYDTEYWKFVDFL